MVCDVCGRGSRSSEFNRKNPFTSKKSMKNESIIIAYHYVQSSEEKPRMRGLLVDAFENQIKLLLSRKYNIVTLGEYLKAAQDAACAPMKKMAALTFDDGLKCHSRTVAPILQKYGVAGTFFIITRPLGEPWLAPVHQIHLVLASAPAAEIKKEAENWLAKNNELPDDAAKKEIVEKCRAMYPWDDAKTAQVKYLLNMHIAPAARAGAVDHLFSAFCGDTSLWADRFYLNKDDVRGMRNRGMEIGCHTHTHPFLSGTARSEQDEEISRSQTILSEIVGEKIALFSYPYGLDETFNQDTVDILKVRGFRAAVTTNKGYAAPSPDAFRLNRIDANDVEKYV